MPSWCYHPHLGFSQMLVIAEEQWSPKRERRERRWQRRPWLWRGPRSSAWSTLSSLVLWTCENNRRLALRTHRLMVHKWLTPSYKLTFSPVKLVFSNILYTTHLAIQVLQELVPVQEEGLHQVLHQVGRRPGQEGDWEGPQPGGQVLFCLNCFSSDDQTWIQFLSSGCWANKLFTHWYYTLLKCLLHLFTMFDQQLPLLRWRSTAPPSGSSSTPRWSCSAAGLAPWFTLSLVSFKWWSNAPYCLNCSQLWLQLGMTDIVFYTYCDFNKNLSSHAPSLKTLSTGRRRRTSWRSSWTVAPLPTRFEEYRVILI